MDIKKNLEAVNNFRKTLNERNKVRSGERLNRSIERKFRTTFIGALSNFEQSFGYLWGMGKPEEELTEEEFKLRQLWIQTRTIILNNGNNQLRAAQSEISEYTIDWNRYHTNILVKDNI